MPMPASEPAKVPDNAVPERVAVSIPTKPDEITGVPVNTAARVVS